MPIPTQSASGRRFASLQSYLVNLPARLPRLLSKSDACDAFALTSVSILKKLWPNRISHLSGAALCLQFDERSVSYGFRRRMLLHHTHTPPPSVPTFRVFWPQVTPTPGRMKVTSRNVCKTVPGSRASCRSLKPERLSVCVPRGIRFRLGHGFLCLHSARYAVLKRSWATCAWRRV